LTLTHTTPESDSEAEMSSLKVTVAELAGLGRHALGASNWRAIEQPRIDGFADATDDHQWIHVDTARAAEGPFGRTIAHGYLTLSLVPAMLDELLVVTDQVRGTNYGLERVRFTNPVPEGSRIRLAATLAGAERRDDGGVRYSVELEVQIEGHERPALVGESVYLSYDV
jgi:acyl dehydratase